MADRMPAEIWVGGQLPHSLLSEFPVSDLRLDWDEHPVEDNRTKSSKCKVQGNSNCGSRHPRQQVH
jgi:hypothetical protein